MAIKNSENLPLNGGDSCCGNEQVTNEMEVREELSESGENVNECAREEQPLDGLSMEELLSLLEQVLGEEHIEAVRAKVESIKTAFYKLYRSEMDAERKAFAEAGGQVTDFVSRNLHLEERFKALYAKFRDAKSAYIAKQDAEKQVNLKLKLEVIEELKELVDSDETLNNTFHKFRELQTKWRQIGAVPQSDVNDLWERYNLHVENFYNFIKINKELRDLDLKKNLERKEELCQAAEKLADEVNVLDAFEKLQKLHAEWRETGPVVLERKEELWQRFKEASTKINKAHQDYFEAIKSSQLQNLAAKTALCDEVESLLAAEYADNKSWLTANEQLLDIQKRWKQIGFAPKKDNTRIYERFRKSCDVFFERKHNYFATAKESMEQNMRLKEELCQAVEALQMSEEWKSTTDKILALQQQWKATGSVPRKYSDQLWRRFRGACDVFFKRKSDHFSEVGNELESNMSKKSELLERMEQLDLESITFDLIKDFQREWSAVGFVPAKQKDAIQARYKAAVDRFFTHLRGGERQQRMARFKDKITSAREGDVRRVRSEREKLYHKIKQIEQEIVVLENNIGFFANSKGAEAMIQDVKNKIARSRTEREQLLEQINFIDNNQK